ncbi:hypothetical protein [Sinorhizobium alkalisoli]|uniref:Uncharacterized protein n=1 Tax=Sinorhizobium alkalisoli TaxID=1752398 RepID=A0A1E3V437_9HYPH|nr:hypothetical protein [Sinorhizobium alkalisoli]MCA1491735.1 hypothetical protein [Ensifer sp. NBAIM29]MCG5480047.1 hypothetical protein [Sinorhizobium alkalisoli]ODR88290.1 hypothetical protein A8M32_27505 [Sinorhizobium alkalisoli]QFI66964.1 hypothetical protein EKH55_2090 [Sinorhizobium alkalisoli]
MMSAERPCDETIRSALARILASDGFQRSERLRAFLAYVVEKEIVGEGAQLKGYSIAVDVFGRCQSFDADSDPLVRVHAGKLRKLLKVFYEKEGAEEEWQIAIPKGTYVPEYRRRREPAATPPQPTGVKRRPGRRGWQPRPFSSPWAVLSVLPLLLFMPLPSPEVTLGIEAEAKLANGLMANVRGLPSVRIGLAGRQHGIAKQYAAALRTAAQRYETLAQANPDGTTSEPAAVNQALSFSVIVAWHDGSEPGLRITLRHDGEGIPIREEFVAAQKLASEADIHFEITSLAARLFALDGEIYAHAAVEGLGSILMECMAATARYKKLLTRESFQRAWDCQQTLGPLKGDEPLFILSARGALGQGGH